MLHNRVPTSPFSDPDFWIYSERQNLLFSGHLAPKRHLFCTLQMLIQFDHFPSLIQKNFKCAKIYSILFGSRLIFFTTIYQKKTKNRPDPNHNGFYCGFRQQCFQNCLIIIKNVKIVREFWYSSPYFFTEVSHKSVQNFWTISVCF